MKINLIFIIKLLGFGGWRLSLYLDEKEQKYRLQQTRVEGESRAIEEAKNQIGHQVTASCSEALERYLAPHSRVLDWIGLKDRDTGERQAYLSYDKTSTGYRQELRATVSGHNSFLRLICFTDTNFSVIDAQYTWLN
jgi:hypothetical protein